MTESSLGMSHERLREARDTLIRQGLLEGNVPTPVPDVIARSWRRSVASEVSPDRLAMGWLDPKGRSELLCRSAEPVLDRLQADLGEFGVAVFLSDARGRVLCRRVGDAAQRRMLDNKYAAEGFDFSEASVGTNGLGTVLEERRPMFVRGAEHFIDLLEPLTCAGAPIRLPATDRVAGSIALTCSVDATNPMMLSLAVRAAREIEQVMADLEGGRNRALVTMFAGKSHATRGPVVVLTPDAVLSNTAGLAYITPEHHPLLWEAVVRGPWGDSPRTIELELPSGPVRAVVQRIVDPAGPAFRVEIQPRASSGARPSSELPPRTTLHPLPDVDERVLRAVRLAASIAIDGHQGTGKHRISRAIAALEPQRGVHVVDLATCRPGANWLPSAQDALSSGEVLILRHLEDIDDDDQDMIRALTTVLRQGAVTSEERTVGRLLLNVDLDKAAPQVASLIRQRAVTVTLPDLCHMKSCIPDLARAILVGLDGINPGITLSSAARQALTAWSWPGNISELRQAMLEVAVSRPGWLIRLDDLPQWIRDATRGRQVTSFERAERDAIVAALREACGNRSAAAALLGIGRTTLYRKIRALGIDCPERMLPDG